MASFDPHEREAELRAEADGWNTADPRMAEPGDVPTVDIGPYLAGAPGALDTAAAKLRVASETIGFFQLVGHGLSVDDQRSIFADARRFHELPLEHRMAIRMDRPEWPLGGVGYLPVGERKLPRRERGNQNEAFLLKSEGLGQLDQNQWPSDSSLPGFRTRVERYVRRVLGLSLSLVPLYERALDLDAGFLADAFDQPLWRLRLTRYPAEPADREAFGIAPHVDTTIFTLLLADGPGLVIYNHESDAWMRVPHIPGALVVNSGELLKQWSNDRFLSARHFADIRGRADDGAQSSLTDRYSIPFFFNANADFVMECLPTCHDDSNPPRYPPVSYRQSQAAVQGE